MSVCAWCKRPTDGTAYHRECWAKRGEAACREAESLLAEFQAALPALKAGEHVQLSGPCRERYAAQIRYWREAANG